MRKKWDALITDYAIHLASGRCRDPEGIKDEIARLRKLQRDEPVELDEFGHAR